MSNKKRSRDSADRTVAERVSLFVSLLALAAVISIVVYLWIADRDEPPVLRVERREVFQKYDQFYLPVTIVNQGGSTATEVLVEGHLKVDDGEETSTLTFDFVPSNSESEGVLIFSSDPSGAKIRVASYRKP